MENVYVANGYESRKDYLNCLAEDYGVSRQDVYQMASMLGSSEDFDGLVSMVEDFADMQDEDLDSLFEGII